MPPVNPQFWLKDVTIRLNVITLMAVHGNLLLALRRREHWCDPRRRACNLLLDPQNLGESRRIVINFIKEIGEQLVLLGAMTPEQLEEAYIVESKAGTPELLHEIADMKG